MRSKVLPPSTSGTVIARGGVVFDSGMVIPLLYVVAPPTSNALQPCISGLLRLSRDLFRDCNLGMWLIESSVGAFAITS